MHATDAAQRNHRDDASLPQGAFKPVSVGFEPQRWAYSAVVALHAVSGGVE